MKILQFFFITFCLGFIAMSFSGDAQTIDEMIEQEIANTKDNIITLPDAEMLKEVESLFIDNLKIMDIQISEQQPEIVDNDTAAKQGNMRIHLTSEERIYIFISSSIPIRTLKRYAEDISFLNTEDKIFMVMRGCINSCKVAMPTIKFIKSVVDNTTASVIIDPLLFRMYNIEEVPTVVYSKKVVTKYQTGSEGYLMNLETFPEFYKSMGDWSLVWHIQELSKESKTKLQR